jgi:hypothetical protein
VNETIDLEERLGEELGMALDAVAVNGVYPQRFSAKEARRLGSLGGRGSVEARAATRAALSEERRARTERSQAVRLRRAVSAPVFSLPHLFEPELGAAELGRLARVLERRL